MLMVHVMAGFWCHSGYGPPEDAVRHGSITLANAVLPQRIRSAIADTIQL